MRKTVIAIITGAVAAAAPHASAQKFALKPHADISLGSPLSLKSAIELNPEALSNEFGLDFGYTFFQKHNNLLEVNAGLGYRYVNATLNAGNFGYEYSASPAADADGNAYIRFCEVSDMRQKLNTAYLTLPVYLRYAYRCTPWMEAHALAGLKLGFNTGSSVKTISGTVYSYGVFPEYDNLMIDAPYLDDFGDVSLTDRKNPEAKVNSFMASLLIGAGLDFRIYGPLWIDLGIRYDLGLSDAFGKGITFSQPNADNVPVKYTVADGTTVRSLSDYITSSKLSPLSIDIGLTVRF